MYDKKSKPFGDVTANTFELLMFSSNFHPKTHTSCVLTCTVGTWYHTQSNVTDFGRDFWHRYRLIADKMRSSAPIKIPTGILLFCIIYDITESNPADVTDDKMYVSRCRLLHVFFFIICQIRVLIIIFEDSMPIKELTPGTIHQTPTYSNMLYGNTYTILKGNQSLNTITSEI